MCPAFFFVLTIDGLDGIEVLLAGCHQGGSAWGTQRAPVVRVKQSAGTAQVTCGSVVRLPCVTTFNCTFPIDA